jgi:hypothetical protein
MIILKFEFIPFIFKIRVIEQENGVLKSLLTKQSLLGGNESSSSSTTTS